ncbi:MAG: hypothetical protein C4567_07615 [Deltaproteobacteria bacterium]|nr:MAG: hypothetical protein C4567_07615 [Deltaproteobacteria bacterium]
MATLHPLAQKYPRLVNSDLSADLNTFYNTVGATLGEYEAALDKARKVDHDLKDSARAERQHRIVDTARRKLNRALNVEIQALNVSAENIRQEIAKAARPQAAETEIRELINYLKETELRAELRKLDSETRARLLRESAGRGDRSILTALENSLTPICAPQLLDAARQSYSEAVATEPMQRLAVVEHITRSATETARRAEYEAEAMLRGAKEILPKPTTAAFESPVKNLSDSEKTRLIGQVGAQGYREILQGARELPLEFALTDETKAALKEWAGETAYLEIMAGKQELPPQFAIAPNE